MTRTCPKCLLLLECCECAPSERPGHDTEQAFWDAVVVRFVAPYAGSGATFGQIINDACYMADALVEQRRKRIAAQAKANCGSPIKPLKEE